MGEVVLVGGYGDANLVLDTGLHGSGLVLDLIVFFHVVCGILGEYFCRETLQFSGIVLSEDTPIIIIPLILRS